MGMMNDGLSYWQTETAGIDLLEITIGDLLDRRADELPQQEAIVYSCQPGFEGAASYVGLTGSTASALTWSPMACWH